MLHIYELDSHEAPVSTLQAGEYIFGRGALLKCNDRRVSRKHGIIKVTDKAATITSTHQNPCFYQTANSPTITILPKDNPVDINDGDKFALLADQFWFRIKFEKNDSNEACKATGSHSSQMLSLSSNCNENGKLVPLSFTSASQSNQVGARVENTNIHNDSDYLQMTQVDSSSGAIPKSSNTCDKADNVNAEDSSDSIDFLQSTQKRVHEADIELSDNKKAKFDNKKEEKNDDENELLSVLGDLTRKEAVSESEGEENNKEEISKPKGQIDKEVMSEPEDENNGKEETSTSKAHNKEIMSDSEDDNITVKVKSDKPKRNPYKWKKGDGSVSSAQSARDSELKSMLFSSDDEVEEVNTDTIDEAKVSSSSKNDDINKDSSLGSNNDGNKTNEGANKRKKDSNDSGSTKNDKADQDSNVASTSSSNGKRQWRDHCWYGLNCYRKSAAHLAEYSHPGDSDYETDPEDDRPMCIFGAACYRRNKDHRQEYKHPSKPQKPPAKKLKKKNNKVATTKKRTARKRYDESSEDDYDLEDPFIDSGTEYEATSSDEDDSDSDWSAASGEETKRLLKEAKRFTKGKKKDKGGDKDDD